MNNIVAVSGEAVEATWFSQSQSASWYLCFQLTKYTFKLSVFRLDALYISTNKCNLGHWMSLNEERHFSRRWVKFALNTWIYLAIFIYYTLKIKLKQATSFSTDKIIMITKTGWSFNFCPCGVLKISLFIYCHSVDKNTRFSYQTQRQKDRFKECCN